MGANPRGHPRGRVVVLLPALNEEEGVRHVLNQIPRGKLEALGYAVSVWVVDGNSTDATLEVIADSDANVFIQDGRGKGNGMRQAFERLLRNRSSEDEAFEDEYYLMLDADGTYPSERIPDFVAALAAGNDVVIGSRLEGRVEEGAMTPLNALGNRVLSALAGCLFGVRVSDVCTGMWGFTADTLRTLGLTAQGFDLEADIFGSACLAGARIAEVPIDYAQRIGAPKLLPLRTGLLIAWRLLLRRLAGKARPPERASKESQSSRGTTA